MALGRASPRFQFGSANRVGPGSGVATKIYKNWRGGGGGGGGGGEE